MTGRVLLLAVHLLDRQIVDRTGAMSGKVDDVEIVVGDDGAAQISALLSGPGVLAGRLGHMRFGRWRERMESALEPPGERMSRVSLRHVRRMDQAVQLSIERDVLASSGTERWVRDHVIERIPRSERQDDT